MRKSAAFLFTLAVSCVLITVMLLFLPLPASLETSEGRATISLRSDRRSVAFPGDCTTVYWSVEGIREVYINGDPTVGEGSIEQCITLDPTTQPLLRVVLEDGNIREYSLPISIALRNPLVWLSGVMALLAAMAAIAVQLSPVFRMLWSPLKRTIRIVEYSLVSLAAIVLLLEIVLRVYFGSFGTEREKVMVLYSAEEIQALPSRILPMPYINYVPSPDFEGHNRMGYRGPEIEVPKPAGIFRIVALGGSTTYSSSTSAEESYPAQLQDILRDSPYNYSNVEVVNAGVPGYTSWDTLVNYVLRVTELDPDMVIIYDGINDVSPRGIDAECYRGQNALRGLNPIRALWNPVEIPVQSAVYRLVAIQLGWMPDPSALSVYSLPPIPCYGQNILDNDRIKDNRPIYFERNLRDIITLAQASNIQVMLSTWTYGLDGDPAAVPPQWRSAVEEHNAILRGLAADYNLPLYDLAATDFPRHPEYWGGPDPIHMSAVGTHEQARQYALFIDQQRLIVKPE